MTSNSLVAAGIRLVNQPAFFSVVWFFAKSVLKKKMRKRVAILGKDYGKLAQWFAPEAIPTELGGTLEHDHAEWLKTK